MTFRKATPGDAEQIWQIITEAKRKMAAEGSRQWTEEYPSRELIEADISSGRACVMCDDGRRVAAYMVVRGDEEPAYADICGQWLTDGPYATVHRLAVAADKRGQGTAHRMMAAAERTAMAEGAKSVRADTNHDNAAMLHLLRSLGYTRCGTVSYGPRGERIAFEKELKEGEHDIPYHNENGI